ncbi:hypothetical protein ACFFNY_23540 [Paenibacillus hodogayensis]|uniref:Small acid-soluble spore protein P n=1 Tax=Paenibacillus hodogayensis TaxID=279208 RepID=A0ABV5W2K4_9BACL
MPRHRRKAFKEQQNMSSMKEEARTLHPEKAKAFPPSANNIGKQS